MSKKQTEVGTKVSKRPIQDRAQLRQRTGKDEEYRFIDELDLKWRENEVTENVRTNVVLLCASFGNTSDAALDDVDSRVHPRLSD